MLPRRLARLATRRPASGCQQAALRLTSAHAHRLLATSTEPALAALQAASFGFPGSPSLTAPIDLTIHAASSGGHALLGRNGFGKTLLAQALADSNDAWLRGGAVSRREGWTPRSLSLVSFESHEAILADGGTVYQALSTRAHLSAAAKFLIVRFGLYDLLYRPVTALSTGEIRKVLLARALASRPSLLVLDNAFDGLDMPSRSMLAELISMTLKGFSPILVQGVDASAPAHTQVLCGSTTGAIRAAGH